MTQAAFSQLTPELYIARAHLPTQALAIAHELKALPEGLWRERDEPGMSFVGELAHDSGRLYNDTGEDITGLLPSIGSVAVLPVFRNRRRVLINRQAPGAEQIFHEDKCQQAPVFVLHASTQGKFDYYPKQSNPSGRARELDTDIGDVVRQDSVSFKHRGRNPSQLTRYTVVLYSRGGDKVEEES